MTIDLNGFAILGPTDCGGGLNPCANAGSGNGISTSNVQFNITIRNGTIQGMGNAGIAFFGASNLVENMHVRSNGAVGIIIFSSNERTGSIVQNNTAQLNGGGGFGINVEFGLVSHNVVDFNSNGILVGGLEVFPTTSSPVMSVLDYALVPQLAAPETTSAIC